MPSARWTRRTAARGPPTRAARARSTLGRRRGRRRPAGARARRRRCGRAKGRPGSTSASPEELRDPATPRRARSRFGRALLLDAAAADDRTVSAIDSASAWSWVTSTRRARRRAGGRRPPRERSRRPASSAATARRAARPPGRPPARAPARPAGARRPRARAGRRARGRQARRLEAVRRARPQAPKATLRATVRCGNSAPCWKTIPIRRSRARPTRRCRRRRPRPHATGVRALKPAITRSSVVLPDRWDRAARSARGRPQGPRRRRRAGGRSLVDAAARSPGRRHGRSKASLTRAGPVPLTASSPAPAGSSSPLLAPPPRARRLRRRRRLQRPLPVRRRAGVQGFEEQTGLEVELRGGTAPELFERLRSEGDDRPPTCSSPPISPTCGAPRRRAARAGRHPALPSRSRSTCATPTEPGGAQPARPHADALDGARPDDAVPTYEDLGDPQFRGRLCLRTTNNEYNQSLVADMLAKRGAAETEALLRSWMANDPQILGSDVDVLEAIAAGRCDVGLTNHYYLARILVDDPDFPVAPAWPTRTAPGRTRTCRAPVREGHRPPGRRRRLLEYLTPGGAGRDRRERRARGQPRRAALSSTSATGRTSRPTRSTSSAPGGAAPAAVALMQRVGWTRRPPAAGAGWTVAGVVGRARWSPRRCWRCPPRSSARARRSTRSPPTCCPRRCARASCWRPASGLVRSWSAAASPRSSRSTTSRAAAGWTGRSCCRWRCRPTCSCSCCWASTTRRPAAAAAVGPARLPLPECAAGRSRSSRSCCTRTSTCSAAARSSASRGRRSRWPARSASRTRGGRRVALPLARPALAAGAALAVMEALADFGAVNLSTTAR